MPLASSSQQWRPCPLAFREVEHHLVTPGVADQTPCVQFELEMGGNVGAGYNRRPRPTTGIEDAVQGLKNMDLKGIDTTVLSRQMVVGLTDKN